MRGASSVQSVRDASDRLDLALCPGVVPFLPACGRSAPSALRGRRPLPGRAGRPAGHGGQRAGGACHPGRSARAAGGAERLVGGAAGCPMAASGRQGRPWRHAGMGRRSGRRPGLPGAIRAARGAALGVGPGRSGCVGARRDGACGHPRRPSCVWAAEAAFQVGGAAAPVWWAASAALAALPFWWACRWLGAVPGSGIARAADTRGARRRPTCQAPAAGRPPCQRRS